MCAFVAYDLPPASPRPSTFTPCPHPQYSADESSGAGAAPATVLRYEFQAATTQRFVSVEGSYVRVPAVLRRTRTVWTPTDVGRGLPMPQAAVPLPPWERIQQRGGAKGG